MQPSDLIRQAQRRSAALLRTKRAERAITTPTPRGIFVFTEPLLKATVATGVTPLLRDAALHDDGSLTRGADGVLRAFCRLLVAKFGDQVVRPIDVEAEQELAPAMHRLAMLPEVLRDVLADPSARNALGDL